MMSVPTSAAAADEQLWLAKRQGVMLDPLVIQLNAGTCSPTPGVVFDRLHDLRSRQAISPTQFQWRDGWQLLAESRTALARYLNAPPENIALVENVTVALNTAGYALDLPAGSEVLVNGQEYGSIIALFERLAAARGWIITPVQLPEAITDPQQLVDAYARAGTDKTRAILFSHVTSPTGLIFPAARLCELARGRGWISVVDGAHAPGQVPVDLAAIDPDFYAANCHKWMMAPSSVGFLYVNRRHKQTCRSVISSWGCNYIAEQRDEISFPGTTFWHYDIEFHGTADRTPQMVLGEVIAFRHSLGGDTSIVARTDHLRRYLADRMRSAGMQSLYPEGVGLAGMLSAFELPKDLTRDCAQHDITRNTPIPRVASRVQRYLWDEGRIECPITFVAGTAYVRVSTAWFNNPSELDLLVDLLPAALAAARH